MRHFFLGVLLLAAFAVNAQEQHEDGTWWDNNLEFKVKEDLLKKFGELEICIFDKKREVCVENLMTTYEIRIYDANSKEIWNSLWTGKDMYMYFSEEFPKAHYIVIKALRPFVINKLTGTRIYQDEAMELKYYVK